MTVLRLLKFVNLPSEGDGRNTLHLFCQYISTNWNHLVPDIAFWALNWTQVEVFRDFITLRKVTNVFDKCSVRISLSTIRPGITKTKTLGNEDLRPGLRFRCTKTKTL